jgi:hypothetical protein
MVVKRDTLLSDLKNHIIDIYFLPETKMPKVRVTLVPHHLPKSFTEDSEQLNEMNNYHNINQNLIGAWNIDRKSWVYFDVGSIKYLESVEDNY